MNLQKSAFAVLAIAIGFSFVFSAAAQPLDGLDEYIENVRQEFGVVGLSVAVVKDDQIVYAKGFGYRELGKPDLVDEHTLFAIGSNTKAFTSAGIGILVDEGKMGWNDRVTDHLPWFELYDPYVTRELNIRDILSHRSGLGRRGDLNWYASDFGREEIVRRIRYLEPNTSFRSQSGYQNTMYLTAGLVLEAVGGTSWDDFIEARFFEPLGMRRSNTSVRYLASDNNVASPHEVFEEEAKPVPYRNIDNIAPAGSINSSAYEMTAWMRLILGKGEFEGDRLVSEAAIAEVHTSHIIYPMSAAAAALFPSTHFSTYGLGWGLRDYQGHLLTTHTGGIDGMLSQIMLVPEKGLGILVLTNTTVGGSFNAITYHILDNYLGAPETDWTATFLELNEQGADARRAALTELEESRVDGTQPSLALEEYVGEYESEMYGQIAINMEDANLVLRRHTQFVGDLTHWHYNTFYAHWRDPGMSGEPGSEIIFTLGGDGKIDSVSLEGMGKFTPIEVTATAD